MRPLAITMGDAAGIGPEIIIKALLDDQHDLASRTIVYGDRATLQSMIDQLKANIQIKVLSSASRWAKEPDKSLKLIECSQLTTPTEFSQIKAAYGKAAANAIERAVIDAQNAEVSALVTAPIHKEALHAAGIGFPGHTEMLAALSKNPPVRMMLANPELRTVLVTIHQSMREAIDNITTANVLETLQITHKGLRLLGIAKPRIAVAGLNPHAGEGGLFGREEIDAIAPAIEKAKQAGIDAHGPFPGDTIFAKARGFKHYDVVIAMYHDQGLIPVKYLGIEQGVNVTLGLPFVRTSVDHGTAFDIAGKQQADHRSLISAFQMAVSMASQTAG
jgi:4-hydroxythreonine-4-phosphate dehydrogenase